MNLRTNGNIQTVIGIVLILLSVTLFFVTGSNFKESYEIAIRQPDTVSVTILTSLFTAANASYLLSVIILAFLGVKFILDGLAMNKE